MFQKQPDALPRTVPEFLKLDRPGSGFLGPQ
jgi:hypothetical protein